MSTLKVNNVTDLGDDAVITDGALVGAGKILQVVSVVKTDGDFSTASTTYVDVTGLTATITPSSATSKIMIFTVMSGGQLAAFVDTGLARLVRTATPIGVGTGADTNDISYQFFTTGTQIFQQSNNFLDSPNTTSAVTYKIEVKTSGAGTFFLNRRGDNNRDRVPSSITLMEVAA